MQYVALAAFAGFLPLQALINARTSQVLGGPLMATLVNFIGGTIMLVAVLALMRVPAPSSDQIGKVPSMPGSPGWRGSCSSRRRPLPCQNWARPR